MADAMLITLRKDPLISYTLPNKVQTYMAAGKPIIAAIDGEAADVIREAKCGYVGEAEDYLDLSRHILYFLRVLPQDGTIAEEVASLTPYQMGFNARSYYDEYFNSEDFLKSLINILES